MVREGSTIQQLIASVENHAHREKVEDLRIGLCYTAALLSDGHLGLAYTIQSQRLTPCCNSLKSGETRGKSAAELIRYALSENSLESSVGIATINALANQIVENGIEGDILKVLTLHQTDVVGMVGFFGPLIEPLKRTVKKLYIFEEKTTLLSPEVYPSEKTPEILPGCDVILISATTLINKTIEPLLRQSTNAREKVVLGATTPFLPQVFSVRGITMLSGIRVVNAPKVLQIVSEGGGMRDFKSSIKKINIPLKKV